MLAASRAQAEEAAPIETEDAPHYEWTLVDPLTFALGFAHVQLERSFGERFSLYVGPSFRFFSNPLLGDTDLDRVRGYGAELGARVLGPPPPRTQWRTWSQLFRLLPSRTRPVRLRTRRSHSRRRSVLNPQKENQRHGLADGPRCAARFVRDWSVCAKRWRSSGCLVKRLSRPRLASARIPDVERVSLKPMFLMASTCTSPTFSASVAPEKE